MPPASSSPSPYADLNMLDAGQLREALRSARRELADRQRHLELIEQHAGIGSWEIDLPRDGVRWSRELKRMHGFDDDTAPTSHADFLTRVLVPEGVCRS